MRRRRPEFGSTNLRRYVPRTGAHEFCATVAFARRRPEFSLY